ncbi:MAG: 2Fe-2S iron-sulfur cluster-binding protein, partial [Pseudomonadota bacterium]|nr:2Fe-2S iron-sulfur cluster-binding protein [Pseudomonadota bacterium]
SILKTTLNLEPQSKFTLVFANRGVNTIMFKEELEDLKNQFMGRLTILHILETGAQDIELFQGRVDGAKCDLLFKHWIDITAMDTAFICGPEPMMLAIADALRAHGLRDEQIKFELFAASQHGRLEQRKTAVTSADKITELGVTIEGAQHRITMNADQSILEASLDHALDAPYACKAGVCSTCRCKVTKGQVDMIANHALEDYEIEQGYVLACQSFPVSDRVDVEFDH